MARNAYFKFKRFEVQQGDCAMKVCTDACTFGAWVDVDSYASILDIGTGTGLLAMMVAQKNPKVQIDAVEYDQKAAEQAKSNFLASPFADQIHIIHTAIQVYDPEKRYDCIISNPPFFQADLRSPANQLKNVAHHADTLNFGDLITSVDRLLNENGVFYVLLPTDEGLIFKQMMEEANWQLDQKMILFHHAGKNPFRALMRFSRGYISKNEFVDSLMYIYEEDGITYTSAFKLLMKEYYLKF